MIINEQKIHLRKIQKPFPVKELKKFNTKGYFYQVQPFDDQYLQKKYQAYQKFRDSQNKQNFVYNLAQQRMRIGFYQMKGCQLNEQKAKKKRRVLKTLNYDNQSVQIKQTKQKSVQFQKVVSTLFKKYLQRKQRLKTKSQRSLTSVFADIKSNSNSIRSTSDYTSQMSYKTSEKNSRILDFVHKKVHHRKIIPTHTQSEEDYDMTAVYKQKIKSRRLRMKTIQ